MPSKAGVKADNSAPKAGGLRVYMMRIRIRLGEIWGLGRPVTHAELARALKLSEKYGGSHISKLESELTGLSGPIEVAIEAMLTGWKPDHFDGVVKPGYPRNKK